MSNPHPSKPFQKGNKYGKGRPVGGVLEWCKEFAEKEGKEILMKWAKSSNSKASIEATKLIFAYGLGKPTEHHEVNGSLNIENLLGISRE